MENSKGGALMKNDDIKAVERLIKNLESLKKRATTAAEKAKAKRESRFNELLGLCTSEEAVYDLYGYADITEDERDRLLELLDNRDNPRDEDLTEDEIYLLELQTLLGICKQRLRDLKWDQLSPEEQERINRETEERHAKRGVQKCKA